MIKGTITFKFIGESIDELKSFAIPLLRQDWNHVAVPDSNIHEFSLSYYNHHAKYALADIRFAMSRLFHELHAPHYLGKDGIPAVNKIIESLMVDISAMMVEDNLEENTRLFRFSVDYECDKYSAEIKLESDFKKVIKKHKPVLENDTIKFIVLEE